MEGNITSGDEHRTVYRCCIIKLYISNLCNINQCYPSKFKNALLLEINNINIQINEAPNILYSHLFACYSCLPPQMYAQWKKTFCLFHSLLYPQGLECSLANKRHSINICELINKWAISFSLCGFPIQYITSKNTTIPLQK